MADGKQLALWTLVGLTVLLVVASFTGSGTGLFGMGWMVGMMWVWILAPIIVLVLLVLALGDRLGARENERRP